MEVKKIVVIVPAKADGDKFNTHWLISPNGVGKLLTEETQTPKMCECDAIYITVMPDGKLISDAAEATANDLAAELLLKYSLTPGDVYIRYESNHGYINLLWWQTINRVWLQKRKEQESTEKPKRSRKKGGTP